MTDMTDLKIKIEKVEDNLNLAERKVASKQQEIESLACTMPMMTREAERAKASIIALRDKNEAAEKEKTRLKGKLESALTEYETIS